MKETTPVSYGVWPAGHENGGQITSVGETTGVGEPAGVGVGVRQNGAYTGTPRTYPQGMPRSTGVGVP